MIRPEDPLRAPQPNFVFQPGAGEHALLVSTDIPQRATPDERSRTGPGLSLRANWATFSNVIVPTAGRPCIPGEGKNQ
jgi:hypothetical protein